MADGGRPGTTEPDPHPAAPPVLVFANGEPPTSAALRACAAHSLVVAADGGVSHAERAGLVVDALIGDFDSTAASTVAHVERRGGVVQRHPTAKDETDLELALIYAVARANALGAGVVVLGSHGARSDHELSNIALLASPRWRASAVSAWLGDSFAQVVWPERPAIVHGQPGSLVSLVPLGGDAVGVSTSGLEYPLRSETLAFGSSRGVSNVLCAPVGSVSVESGPLLVIQPNHQEELS